MISSSRRHFLLLTPFLFFPFHTLSGQNDSVYPPAPAAGGYTSNDGGNRDILLHRIFPDLRIGIAIIDTPRNEFDGNLGAADIRSAILLGARNWASVLPQMNVRIVPPDSANLVVRFEDNSYASYGFLPSGWSESGNTLRMSAANLAFRRKDFVSSRMCFDYFQALTNPGSAHFSDLPLDFQNDWGLFGKRYRCVCWDSMPLLGPDATPHWDVGCPDWKSIPWYSVMGKMVPGYWGLADLSLAIQHELGHTLLGLHVYDEGFSTCDSLVHYPQQRFDWRRRGCMDESMFIMRGRLRKDRLPSITGTTSHSVLISRGYASDGIWNDRGIFDIDADRLASGHAAPPSCGAASSASGAWRGYDSVSYPVIRKGWLIEMEHRRTHEKFYTNNWHTAHRMMLWVDGDNTRPADNDWFQVGMLDEKEASKIYGFR